MPNRFAAYLSRLKLLIAAVLIAALLYLVKPLELWHALAQLSAAAVICLILLSVLLIYISALKWKLFLESFGNAVNVFHLFKLYVLGYFVNLFMPSYLGGDAVRSFYIGRKVGQHDALAATILERYTGLAAMLVLALIFVWFVDYVTWEMKLAVVGVALALTTATFVALSTTLTAALGRITKLAPLMRHIGKIQEALDLARRNHALLLKALGLSFLFHTATVVNTLVCAHAVGWTTAPAGELFVVLPLILIIGAVPLAPSGLGVQEGAFYFFLTAVGATPAQALGIGVILRAKQVLIAGAGALIWAAERRPDARAPQGADTDRLH